MNAVEQFRNAVFPHRTYANWVFLVVLVGWTLFLLMRFFRGDSDWPTILLILMSLTLTGWMIRIIRGTNAPASETVKKKRDPIVNWLFLFVSGAWVISLVIGFFVGEINWSFSLTLLAFMLAAWFLDLNGNWESVD
ncbi:MAG: hypothetical protein ACNA8K_17470 [Cyclonatronaceae bacterium]